VPRNRGARRGTRGSFAYGYDKIGVAIARSDSSGFATALGKDNRVEGVSSTATFA
jgi:hypothetical protein